jgi:ethanolamine utilization cobalamin adenosyltransferase
MSDAEFGPVDTTGIIKESKKALRVQRDARLTQSLRDNLARRKLQIRARNDQRLINEADVAND